MASVKGSAPPRPQRRSAQQRVASRRARPAVSRSAEPQPTNLAPLAALLAYTQGLGLERYLARPKRGLSTLALALVWLVLAWRGSGRPYHVDQWNEPLLAALLGQPRLPCSRTLYRSLRYFSTHAVRAALEASYRAALGRRGGDIWVAIDSHQLPYWGRQQQGRFEKGWSGTYGRSLRGYRLFLVTDTQTGQIVTFVLARGKTRDSRLLVLLAQRARQVLGTRLGGVVADCGFTSRPAIQALQATRIPFIVGFARTAPVRQQLARLDGYQRRWLRDGGAIRLGPCAWGAGLQLFALSARTPSDDRGPWVYVTNLRRGGPQRWAALYRRRWRVEPVIDELRNGHDLDHLVTTRLGPNRVALGFRLLARNLALGYQLAQAAPAADPPPLAEPHAFCAAQVEGLGQFLHDGRTIYLRPLQPTLGQTWTLPWTRRRVRLAS